MLSSKELTSNSDLIRYFQNVKQIYLRGILTRKLYDPFIFLTPYWENHFQVMKIKLSCLEILEGLTTHYIRFWLLKFQGKIVLYQGLVFFLPVVVFFLPRSGTKSTTTGILITNKLWRRYLSSNEATLLTIQKDVSL